MSSRLLTYVPAVAPGVPPPVLIVFPTGARRDVRSATPTTRQTRRTG
ncbi:MULTISPECIES: hypothetical protein [unclassified Kitasatospora]|nr:MULTISPECIES: hypothetical protein [unclassified Kitasatospora]